jgi:hypothetical protein
MRITPVPILLCLGGIAWSSLASAQAAPEAPVAPSHQPDDRLIFSTNGTTLTGTNGGGGGSVGWLRNPSADSVIGAGVEHQTIADAHWTFGSVSGALSRGASNERLTLYGEIHEGSGKNSAGSFKYSIVSAGISRALTGRLSLQLEDRQIDVDTTNGNLGKLGLSFVWTPRLLTALAYSHSVGSSLDRITAGGVKFTRPTALTTLRIDEYGKKLHVLAGGAVGKASPAVVDHLNTANSIPGQALREVFLGVAVPFSNAELTLLGDYLDLSSSKRTTVTLSYMVHLRAHAKTR